MVRAVRLGYTAMPPSSQPGYRARGGGVHQLFALHGHGGVWWRGFAGANEPTRRTASSSGASSWRSSSAASCGSGRWRRPPLLRLSNAAPEVAAEALLFLRGMSRASRARHHVLHAERVFWAGWRPRTPCFNWAGTDGVDHRVERRADPHDGHLVRRSARSPAVPSSAWTACVRTRPASVIDFERGTSLCRITIIRSLFRSACPWASRGIAMNVVAVACPPHCGAQRGCAGGIRRRSAEVVLVDDLDALGRLMGASATIAGQNLARVPATRGRWRARGVEIGRSGGRHRRAVLLIPASWPPPA